jgi:DNA repair protein RecN (Recombination protein N)
MNRLLRLTIEGVGLIDRAEVSFGEGFTAFTGETGSGKTMLLGALDAALGGRVERDMVRAERARVTLEVDAAPPLRELLAAEGIALDPDDDLIVVRELNANGRSLARINGSAVSASQLRAVGAQLVDAVGQGEAQRLLEPGFARDALDAFGGTVAADLRRRLASAYDERRALRAEREALHAGTERAAADRDFARFARDEIDAAALEPEEDVRVRERRDVLGNAEAIALALGQARAAIEDENGAGDALGAAAHALGSLARYGATFAPLADAAAAVQAEANDLAAAVARAADAIERDPLELETVAARLDQIETLKKKYGGSLESIAAARDRFAATVDADAGRDERLGALDARIAALDEAIAADAAALRAARMAAARAAEERVSHELHALAMPAARFAIAVDPLDEVAAHGADRVTFQFSANPGEPERPLARIASGGERSRVLLALVVALSDRADARAFVFDEIDAGIGGATAVAVGARLQRLAGLAQVVCVTHLAQIASYAQTHYALRKREHGGTTTIDVVPMQAEDDRLAEIARMLSGETTGISLEHAATLVASTRSAR